MTYYNRSKFCGSGYARENSIKCISNILYKLNKMSKKMQSDKVLNLPAGYFG
ncbi:dicarboxylate transporter/tellurite-resistance protein TehA, partial [Escherichia coli]